MAKTKNKTSKSKKIKLKALISWKIKDFDNPKRSFRFFAIVYSALFLITIYGLMTNNLLLSVLTILFGFIFFVFEKKEPEEVLFAITKKGVFIKDHLYKYNEIESFWIDYEENDFKEIVFKTSVFLSPYLKIPLENADPTKARKFLLKFIPEKKHERSPFDFIDKL